MTRREKEIEGDLLGEQRVSLAKSRENRESLCRPGKLSEDTVVQAGEHYAGTGLLTSQQSSTEPQRSI